MDFIDLPLKALYSAGTCFNQMGLMYSHEIFSIYAGFDGGGSGPSR